MYCPNCGKTNLAEQNFCRSCGLNLEKISHSIAEHLPAEDLDKHIQDRRRIVDCWIVKKRAV
ncbi:MAG: zinc-ribbon domain-containing protein [Acidobacteriota bacterium]